MTLRQYIIIKIKERKKDLIIILCLLVVSIALLVCFNLTSKHGSKVNVYVNNKLVKSFDLDKDKRYLIKTKKGYNFLIIKNKEARIVDADCANKICVDKGYISNDNESIICAPHDVIVTIDSDEKAQVDAVAN